MNDYGISLYTANGREYFSTRSATWNYIGQFVVAPYQDVSYNYPALALVTEVTFQRAFLKSPPGNQEAYMPTPWRSGTTVGASGGSVGAIIVVLAR